MSRYQRTIGYTRRLVHHHHAIPTLRQLRGYQHCVRPYRCTEGAHGNICWVETCRCGMTRSVNVNQHWVERGSWRLARPAGMEEERA